jgi:hypothetical protein
MAGHRIFGRQPLRNQKTQNNPKDGSEYVERRKQHQACHPEQREDDARPRGRRKPPVRDPEHDEAQRQAEKADDLRDLVNVAPSRSPLEGDKRAMQRCRHGTTPPIPATTPLARATVAQRPLRRPATPRAHTKSATPMPPKPTPMPAKPSRNLLGSESAMATCWSLPKDHCQADDVLV